jgi:hypothetical protein
MPYWLVIILVAFPSGKELHTIGHPVKYASQQECEAAVSKSMAYLRISIVRRR